LISPRIFAITTNRKTNSNRSINALLQPFICIVLHKDEAN